MQDVFSAAREVAHAAVAIVGSLAASAAVIVSLLSPLGVHVTDAQLLQGLGLVGGAAALLSKLIDSVNDAVKGHPPA